MKLSDLTLALGLAAQASAAAASTSSYTSYINYTTVTGYFLQDEESTDPSTFDYTATNFGLINRPYDADTHHTKNNGKPKNEDTRLTSWERFHRQLIYLNDHSPDHISYKLFFLGRHGEGYHNAAESYYGTPAWNCYWSLLIGNGSVTWSDADLTDEGIAQAEKAHAYWTSRIAEENIHVPDAFYVSPMTRALRTANITFTGLRLSSSSSSPSSNKKNGKGTGKNNDQIQGDDDTETLKYTPTVKESFREGISLHTCDRRRSKSYIQSLFPEWEIEEGFTEDDELWTGVYAETSEAQDARSRGAFDEIFSSSSFSSSSAFSSVSGRNGKNGKGKGKGKGKDEDDLVISITAHSGEIASILRVVGHRAFRLSTGAVIPVLVRAEVIREREVKTKTEPAATTTATVTESASWTVSAHCTEPPVTSLASCVCASSAAPVTTPLIEI